MSSWALVGSRNGHRCLCVCLTYADTDILMYAHVYSFTHLLPRQEGLGAKAPPGSEHTELPVLGF